MQIGFIDIIQGSLWQVYANVVAVLPAIIGAFLVFIIGLILAPLAGGIIKKLIELTHIDSLTRKAGIKEALGGFGDVSIASVIGKLVKWFVLFVSLVAAAEILDWPQLSALLNEIVLYIPNVIIAVVVIAVGLVAGQFVAGFVERAAREVGNSRTLAKITKAAIVLFSVLVALTQLGIAPSLIQILFGGLVFALALAFGLGGRDKAAELLSKIR